MARKEDERSEWTKRDRKIVLRKFLKYILKLDVADEIKVKTIRNGEKLPEEILTEEEIKKIRWQHTRHEIRLSSSHYMRAGVESGSFSP
ncbi:MAG: hypothetical protein ACXQT5_00795 [Candidatus Syntropharchaeia archaeon]